MLVKIVVLVERADRESVAVCTPDLYVCMYRSHGTAQATGTSTCRVWGGAPVAYRHNVPPYTSAGSARALAGVCRVLAVSGCVGVIGTVGSSTPLLPYPRPPYATALGVLQYSSLTPTYLPHYYHCPWGSGKGGLHTAIALKTTHDQTTSCLVVSLSSPRTTLRYATHVGVVSQYTSVGSSRRYPRVGCVCGRRSPRA